MRTSKPFSTISYNTDNYLTVKLDELIKTRKIEFYAFIEHLPESDETKLHKHLLIIPNGTVNTDQIQDYLIELDPTNAEGKPLGCIMCRSSKFGDWYLYVLHDVGYLAQRGQSRQFQYKESEMRVSNPDYLRELVHTIDYSPYTRFTQIRQAAEDGIAFEQLVWQGLIPIQQYPAYEKAYQSMVRMCTDRNGRKGHETPDDEIPAPRAPSSYEYGTQQQRAMETRTAAARSNRTAAVYPASPQPKRTVTPDRQKRSHTQAKQSDTV